MKVKELDVNNPNIQKCFKYLQEYDPQNCLLLSHLLEGIYEIAQRMSITSFVIQSPLWIPVGLAIDLQLKLMRMKERIMIDLSGTGVNM